jgi:hypothetical protein
MAAPGVQLNSDKQLEYFEPTVDQYVKKLEQAVASNDLSTAKQALANLNGAMTNEHRSTSNGTGVPDSEQTSTAMNDIGSALENGDLTSAESAVGELRKSLSSARGVPLDSNGNASQSSSLSSEDVDDSPERSQDTSGKLDLRA